MEFFHKTLPYKVLFHEFDTKRPEVVYEDRSLTVSTIPLKHRIPCCGFLFEEKQVANHIIREMTDFYKVPVYELNRIKNGADFVTPDGELIDRKSTRLNSSHANISYAVFCLKKKTILLHVKY